MTDTDDQNTAASPAAGDVADHHGQDAGRETLSAGAAQREPGALGERGEQSLPAMSQNNASDEEKIAGIAAQTRSDVGTDTIENITHVLAQRLEQAGVVVPADEVDALARRIAEGDSLAE